MEFQRIYDWEDGIGLKGYLTTDYQRLVDTFGEPHNLDDVKSDAEWDMRFKDGEIAMIYNYRNGKNCRGEEGTPTESITVWNVGARRAAVVTRVARLLKLKRNGERHGFPHYG